MANWNGHLLFFDPDGASRGSGALIPLSTPIAEEGFALLSDGDASVQVVSGHMLVRLDDSASPDSIAEQAISVAADGLDMLAAHGGPIGTVRLGSDAALVWWTEGSSRVARVTSRYGLALRMSIGEVQVIDAEGNVVVQPPPPDPLLHEGLRYFRLSQCTDDLFDAFRNAYLAIEATLSDIRPKAPGETEGAWLKAAVAQSQAVAELHQILGCEEADTATRFHDDVYKAVRCPLFHGKAMGLDASSSADRKLVFEAYQRVAQCYMALAGVRYFIRPRGGGGFTPEGFAGLNQTMEAWTLMIGDGDLTTEYSDLVAMESASMAPLPNRIRRIGTLVAPLDPVPDLVNLVAAAADGQVVYRESLQGHLYLDSLHRVEVVLELWNDVDHGYRTVFAG